MQHIFDDIYGDVLTHVFKSQVCINTKCQDPCKVGGTCGINAHCRVRNHYSDCYCPEGFFGDPYSQCRPVPRPPPTQVGLSCPSPECGPNSICEVRTFSLIQLDVKSTVSYNFS